ncbi:BofC C-terminal domain-containing protein [Gorillibacterium sp. CAU 1737]|uniref:BofC C-terminal domain-containing protein n=1 Tax=Gorillibacterium sp. CAU 1737 TaxID=3140362 RepID=UPI0032614297
MRLSSWMKKLKKQLRSRKRRISLAAIILLSLSVAGQAVDVQAQAKDRTANQSQAGGASFPLCTGGLCPILTKTVLPSLNPMKGKHEEGALQAIETMVQGVEARQSFHRRVYVCGEELQALGPMTKRDLMLYATRFPQASASLTADGQVMFTEEIEDLSPGCKENAFFGMDAGGNLTLYDGVPEDQKVIRTFFQLNVEDLRSSLPADAWDELHTGIRVRDLEEFQSVLSTFSDYMAVSVPAVSTKP